MSKKNGSSKLLSREPTPTSESSEERAPKKSNEKTLNLNEVEAALLFTARIYNKIPSVMKYKDAFRTVGFLGTSYSVRQIEEGVELVREHDVFGMNVIREDLRRLTLEAQEKRNAMTQYVIMGADNPTHARYNDYRDSVSRWQDLVRQMDDLQGKLDGTGADTIRVLDGEEYEFKVNAI